MGDSLWALMVYWGFCVVFRGESVVKISLLAWGFSFGIEFLQIYQVPWMQEIRHTKLGGLVLGFGFKWEDLICYSVGILTGLIVEQKVLKFREV